MRLYSSGMAVKDIASTLRMVQATVRSAVTVVAQGGVKALAPKPTGRAVDQHRRLTAEQELRIQHLICKNRPEQLKLTSALISKTRESNTLPELTLSCRVDIIAEAPGGDWFMLKFDRVVSAAGEYGFRRSGLHRQDA